MWKGVKNFTGSVLHLHGSSSSKPSPKKPAAAPPPTEEETLGYLPANESSLLIHILKGLFSGNDLFTHKTDADYITLVKHFKLEDAEKGTVITKPGKVGGKMYIIKEGLVDVFVNEQYQRTMSKGDVIGELALFHNAPRSALCVVSSAEGAVLYSLSRKQFDVFIANSFDAQDRKISKLLLNVPELVGFPERSKLIKTMKPRRYTKGDRPFEEGQPAVRVLLVEKGCAAVFTREDLSDLGPRDVDTLLGIVRDTGASSSPKGSAGGAGGSGSGGSSPEDRLNEEERETLRQLKEEYQYRSIEPGRTQPARYFACLVDEGCVLGVGALKGRAGVEGGWAWHHAFKSNNNANSGSGEVVLCGALSPFTAEVLSPVLRCFSFTVFSFERMFGLDYIRGQTHSQCNISLMVGVPVFERDFFRGEKRQWEKLGGGGELSYGFVLLAEERAGEESLSMPDLHRPLRTLAVRPGPLRRNLSSGDLNDHQTHKNTSMRDLLAKEPSLRPRLEPREGSDLKLKLSSWSLDADLKAGSAGDSHSGRSSPIMRLFHSDKVAKKKTALHLVEKSLTGGEIKDMSPASSAPDHYGSPNGSSGGIGGSTSRGRSPVTTPAREVSSSRGRSTGSGSGPHSPTPASRSSPLNSKASPELSSKNLAALGKAGRPLSQRFAGVFGMADRDFAGAEREPGQYAVKFFNKAQLIHLADGLSIGDLVEKMKLLASLSDCPFLVKLHGVLATQSQVGFVLEPLLHGSLAAMLKARRDAKEARERAHKIVVTEPPLPLASVRFYSACLAAALDFLGEHLVVYRDLTPRNVLFDGRGYPRLIDFTRSKRLEETDARFNKLLVESGVTDRVKRIKKTYTLTGCASRRDVCYRAPEYVSGRGHDTAVDLWSLGVLVFEMLTGHTPYDCLDPRLRHHVDALVPLAKQKTAEGAALPPGTQQQQPPSHDMESIYEGDEAEAAAAGEEGEEQLEGGDGEGDGVIEAQRSSSNKSYTSDIPSAGAGAAEVKPRPRQLFYAMVTCARFQEELGSIGDMHARDLVRRLLVMEPEERFGARMSRLFDHAYFRPLPKDDILDGSYCPEVRPERYKRKLVKDVDLFIKFDGPNVDQRPFYGFRN